jgi:hypothetical protein
MAETCRILAVWLYTFVSNCCAVLHFSNCALWHTSVIRTDKMHTFYIYVLFNYSVIDMFQTTKCSSSGGLVHTVVRYFFHAEIIINIAFYYNISMKEIS